MKHEMNEMLNETLQLLMQCTFVYNHVIKLDLFVHCVDNFCTVLTIKCSKTVRLAIVCVNVITCSLNSCFDLSGCHPLRWCNHRSANAEKVVIFIDLQNKGWPLILVVFSMVSVC